MEWVQERGSGCFALVHGSRGGAEISVFKDRKKREGKKKGLAGSYFSTVATGLRGILTIPSDFCHVSVSHTQWTNKAGFQGLLGRTPPTVGQHAQVYQVCFYPPDSYFFFPTEESIRSFGHFLTLMMNCKLFLCLPVPIMKWRMTSFKDN